ncbi:FAD-dependent oxidoreductase [Mesorhizobium salmacidum]|uniref:FAD-dependent oxidoreductase n=1 Tax=Mesorhizobium salmacidum TaxID=3015171 RepID=A0ABU8L5K5_9HYPH
MSASALPSHASVVVIGGGIMGCSTLYHLVKMGVSDAILLERNKLTSGTTWHSAAQVRALRHSHNMTRMVQYSVDLYSQLERETGQSVGWIQKGSLALATTPDRETHLRRQKAQSHAVGLRAEWIEPGEAKELWPLVKIDDVLGALWSPDDGRISPSDACAALTKSAKALGARIFENTGVTGIITRNGRVKAVETTAGIVNCDSIAICAGLWSREVGAMGNAALPVLACEHFYLLTKPIEGLKGNLPTLGDHDNHLYFRDDSGGLLTGCFEPHARPIAPGALDETFEFGLLPENWDHFEPMMLAAMKRIPALETAEVKMLLNGPESFTPDGMFMLGEAAETRGLFLGCGMNSVGLASGGGAGMNLAHCIVLGRTAYDLSEADAKRFPPVFNSVEHLMARAPEVLGAHYELSYPGRQRRTARNLRLTPLDSRFRAAGALMGQFYGWERPLYFGATSEPKLGFGRPDWFENVRAEVKTAHEGAAIFDASTFGKIDVQGIDACRFLQRICMRNMDRPAGTAIYTAILNEQGNYVSDLTAHRISDDHYRLFVGTTSVRHDLAWLEGQMADSDVVLTDVTESLAQLALMGPAAAQVAVECGAPELKKLGYFQVGTAHLMGTPVRAVRMSYVGEAGWEITCNVENAGAVYDGLVMAGARPAGLYAQTSMRIEKGFAAIGHELDGDLSPVEIGLEKMAKAGGFVGAEALARKREALRRSLVTIVMDDDAAVPLGREPVYVDGELAGQTTSAAYGFRVGAPISLAHVRDAVDGKAVEVDIAGKRTLGRMQFAAAFDPTGSRMRTD